MSSVLLLSFVLFGVCSLTGVFALVVFFGVVFFVVVFPFVLVASDGS